MLFELIKQGRKLTLLSYLFLQVSGLAYGTYAISQQERREKEISHLCAFTLCELPIPEPGKTHSCLMSPYCLLLHCSPSILSSQDFLPSLAWSPVKVPRKIQ